MRDVAMSLIRHMLPKVADEEEMPTNGPATPLFGAVAVLRNADSNCAYVKYGYASNPGDAATGAITIYASLTLALVGKIRP